MTTVGAFRTPSPLPAADAATTAASVADAFEPATAAVDVLIREINHAAQANPEDADLEKLAAAVESHARGLFLASRAVAGRLEDEARRATQEAGAR